MKRRRRVSPEKAMKALGVNWYTGESPRGPAPTLAEGEIVPPVPLSGAVGGQDVPFPEE